MTEEQQRIAQLFVDRLPRTDEDPELPGVGALFPDLLRLLCRWRWHEGGVVITGRPFREDHGPFGISANKPDDMVKADRLERFADAALPHDEILEKAKRAYLDLLVYGEATIKP